MGVVPASKEAVTVLSASRLSVLDSNVLQLETSELKETSVSDRTTIAFPSGTGTCTAWLYRPDSARTKPPVIVMAHGLGGVKEMRLDAYAERFRAAGYACLVFDYRHFGDSSGQPRQLLDIDRQLEDWRAALAWVRAHPELDGDRVALFGTSFGGGHVIQTAADDQGVCAVIAQCPFTDGPASLRQANRGSLAKVTGLALLDLAAAALRRPPVRVPTAGPVGSAALMTAPDCEAGYLALTADAANFRNEVAARFALHIGLYRPGRRTPDISCPIFFAICEYDTVAPAAATQRHAARSPQGETRIYPFGHFDIYLGDAFERAVTDYLQFLSRHMPTT
jgi:dienelactone hydrolase